MIPKTYKLMSKQEIVSLVFLELSKLGFSKGWIGGFSAEDQIKENSVKKELETYNIELVDKVNGEYRFKGNK